MCQHPQHFAGTANSLPPGIPSESSFVEDASRVAVRLGCNQGSMSRVGFSGIPQSGTRRDGAGTTILGT
jgi:hypothetical protein